MSTTKNLSQTGFTLIEAAITIAIIGIFFVSMTGVFNNIGIGILSNKSRTLAVNLAQEKIELMKNIDYYRLMVTTPPYTSSYDMGSYPAENLQVGDITFQRQVLVEKVREGAGGNYETLSWDARPDDGLKKITVTVIWGTGDDIKSLSLSNIRRNPNFSLAGSVSGTVKESGTLTSLANVRVFLESMPVYYAYTNAGGAYTINTPTGTHWVAASIKTHQTSRLSASANPNATGVDFTLTAKGKGNAYGYVFKRDHLVISEVCAAVNGDDTDEYIELYNPTTSQIELGTGMGAVNIKLNHITDTNVVMKIDVDFSPNHSVPAHGFYLIATKPNPGGGVVARDATMIPTGIDCIPMSKNGGVSIAPNSFFGFGCGYGIMVDSVSWGRAGKPAPSAGCEGTGITLPGAPGHGGLDDDWIERKAYPTSTEAGMSSGGTDWGNGNGLDSNNNTDDWVFHDGPMIPIIVVARNYNPSNTLPAYVEHPTGGTPISTSYVFFSDDMSEPCESTTGYYYIRNIATGTWNIAGSSDIYISSFPVTVNLGATSSQNIIISSNTSEYAYLTGTLKKIDLSVADTLSCDAGGPLTYSNAATGNFFLPVSTGTITGTINRDNADIRYAQISSGPFTVEVGEMHKFGDIVVPYNGAVSGMVLSPNGDPLPNMVIIAYDTGLNLERAIAQTSSTGYYLLTNITSGGGASNYRIYPALMTGEVVTAPVSGEYAVTLNPGDNLLNKNFTIGSAMGEIIGTVKYNFEPIKTGVLILATTTELLGDPPTMDNAFRTGSKTYFFTSSRADGTFILPVRGASGAGTLAYNVYAWYSTVSGTSVSFTMKQGSTNISSGGTGSVNLSWP